MRPNNYSTTSSVEPDGHPAQACGYEAALTLVQRIDSLLEQRYHLRTVSGTALFHLDEVIEAIETNTLDVNYLRRLSNVT